MWCSRIQDERFSKVISVTNDTYSSRSPSSASHGSITCRRICGGLSSMRRRPSSPRCKPGRWNSLKSWRTPRSSWADAHTLPHEDLAEMKTLLSGVADQVTKNQPAVHDMLDMVRAVAAKLTPLGRMGRSSSPPQPRAASPREKIRGREG